MQSRAAAGGGGERRDRQSVKKRLAGKGEKGKGCELFEGRWEVVRTRLEGRGGLCGGRGGRRERKVQC